MPKYNYLNIQYKKSLVFGHVLLSFLVPEVVAYSPEVKCRCALISCTQAFTLQPVFSSDDYMFSCKFCPILQQHLSFRQKASIAFIIRPVTFTAVLMSHQNGTQASEDNSSHMSLRPCMFPLAQPHSQHFECFESPQFPFHSRHSRLVEHFGSF